MRSDGVRGVFGLCCSLAAALAASVVLAACGPQAPAAGRGDAAPTAGSASKPQGWDELVAAAQQEGNLVVYGTPGTPYRSVLVTEFERAYPGIKVDGIFIPASEAQSRVALERQAGRYLADVIISPGGSLLQAYRDGGWIVPLRPQLMLPEVVDEANWFQNRFEWADTAEPHHWMLPVGSVLPIVFVNRSVDASQFKSYRDLLDPKWKGKLASTDIRNPGPGVAPSRFVRKSPELGPSFLQELFAPGNVKLSSDQRQLIDWVAQGTYPVGLFMDPGEVAIAIKQSLPITIVPPDQFKEGAAIGPNNAGVAMFDRAPHPTAAKVYINWYLSKEGQMAWQREVGDNSLRTDIPKDTVNPLFVPKPGVNYVNAGTEEIVTQFPTPQLKELISD